MTVGDIIAHALDESLEPRNRLQGVIARLQAIAEIPHTAEFVELELRRIAASDPESLSQRYFETLVAEALLVLLARSEIPEGRRSPPAGALESGSPLDAARDANPGSAVPGGVDDNGPSELDIDPETHPAYTLSTTWRSGTWLAERVTDFARRAINEQWEKHFNGELRAAQEAFYEAVKLAVHEALKQTTPSHVGQSEAERITEAGTSFPAWSPSTTEAHAQVRAAALREAAKVPMAMFENGSNGADDSMLVDCSNRILDLMDVEAPASTTACSGELDMSQSARLKDAEDDVLRLHREKMAFFEDKIRLERELAAAEKLANGWMKAALDMAPNSTMTMAFAPDCPAAFAASRVPVIHALEKAAETTASAIAEIDAWRPMLTAPLDGTELELMVRHFDYFTALKVSGKEAADGQYQGNVIGKWIDHNGGGWTWSGHAGSPVGWRPMRRADGGKQA